MNWDVKSTWHMQSGKYSVFQELGAMMWRHTWHQVAVSDSSPSLLEFDVEVGHN